MAAIFEWRGRETISRPTRSVTETRTYIRAGAQNVEVSGGDTELAWIAGAGVSKMIGRNELFADLARNVGPSSAGVIVTRDPAKSTAFSIRSTRFR